MTDIPDLKISVDQLSAEAAKLRRMLRWVVVVGACVIVTLGGAIAAAAVVQVSNSQAIAENNARWCPMLELLVPQPGDAPPATDRARRIIQQAQALADAYGCHRA